MVKDERSHISDNLDGLCRSNKQNRNRLTDRENRPVVAGGEGVEKGWVKKGKGLRCTN